MRHFSLPVAASALLFTLFIAPPISPRFQGICPTAFAEELWKEELLALCAKTDEANSFSNDELKKLLLRGEKLKPAIDSLEETPRKIHLKRLQRCMNLFSFVLESKEADKK